MLFRKQDFGFLAEAVKLLFKLKIAATQIVDHLLRPFNVCEFPLGDIG